MIETLVRGNEISKGSTNYYYPVPCPTCKKIRHITVSNYRKNPDALCPSCNQKRLQEMRRVARQSIAGKLAIKGDKIKRNSRHNYYLVHCPECGQGRYVQASHYKRCPDAKCQACCGNNRPKAKIATEVLDKVFPKIQIKYAHPVCKHYFIPCEDGKSCLYCGYVVYKQ